MQPMLGGFGSGRVAGGPLGFWSWLFPEERGTVVVFLWLIRLGRAFSRPVGMGVTRGGYVRCVLWRLHFWCRAW